MPLILACNILGPANKFARISAIDNSLHCVGAELNDCCELEDEPTREELCALEIVVKELEFTLEVEELENVELLESEILENELLRLEDCALLERELDEVRLLDDDCTELVEEELELETAELDVDDDELKIDELLL